MFRRPRTDKMQCLRARLSLIGTLKFLPSIAMTWMPNSCTSWFTHCSKQCSNCLDSAARTLAETYPHWECHWARLEMTITTLVYWLRRFPYLPSLPPDSTASIAMVKMSLSWCKRVRSTRGSWREAKQSLRRWLRTIASRVFGRFACWAEALANPLDIINPGIWEDGWASPRNTLRVIQADQLWCLSSASPSFVLNVCTISYIFRCYPA